MKQFINQRKLRNRFNSLSERYQQIKKESTRFKAYDLFLEDLDEFMHECNAIMMSCEYTDKYKSEAQYWVSCVSHMVRRLSQDKDE